MRSSKSVASSSFFCSTSSRAKPTIAASWFGSLVKASRYKRSASPDWSFRAGRPSRRFSRLRSERGDPESPQSVILRQQSRRLRLQHGVALTKGDYLRDAADAELARRRFCSSSVLTLARRTAPGSLVDHAVPESRPSDRHRGAPRGPKIDDDGYLVRLLDDLFFELGFGHLEDPGTRFARMSVPQQEEFVFLFYVYADRRDCVRGGNGAEARKPKTLKQGGDDGGRGDA